MVIFISYEIFYNINKASVLDGLNSNQRPGISVQTCFLFFFTRQSWLHYSLLSINKKRGKKDYQMKKFEIKTKSHKM